MNHLNMHLNQDSGIALPNYARPRPALATNMRNVDSPQHENVIVLLVSWDDPIQHDDMSIETEIKDLHRVFYNEYGFRVERFRIPRQWEAARRAFKQTLSWLQTCFSNSNSLVIVYYGGHSDADNLNLQVGPQRYKCLDFWGQRMYGWEKGWSQEWDPSVSWGRFQLGLEAMNADVLIILDSCDGAAVVNTTNPANSNRKKEVIAAAGFPGTTYGFAKHLIPVLYQLSNYREGFRVSELYRCILERAVLENHHRVSSSMGGNLKNPPTTPVHFPLGNANQLSILIKSHKRTENFRFNGHAGPIWGLGRAHAQKYPGRDEWG